MAEDEAGRRIDAQADDATRLAAADLVVDASGTLDETRAHADELYERLRSLSAAKADVRLGPGVSGRS
nr:hypothetical protein GCM10025699_53280 [Microbacterium flavescens]